MGFLYDTERMEAAFILDKIQYFSAYDTFFKTTLGLEPIFQGSEL